MATTAREALVTALTPLLPRRWKLIDTQRAVDERSTTTVQLKQMSIAPLAQAPSGWLYTRFVLTITSLHKDLVKAEHQLDDDVLGLVHALDQIDGLIFDDAIKVSVDQQQVGYDVTIHIPSRKE